MNRVQESSLMAYKTVRRSD